MDCNSELGHQSEQNIPSSLQEGRDIEEVVELVDIISLLPDHLIAKVLSWLETKEAIRTCILSSRWRNLWKGITRIQLGGYIYRPNPDPEHFLNLVEHVLQNCSSTYFVSFELVCPLSIDLSHLKAWIGFIVSRKIEQLCLCANYSPNFDYELPQFPLPQFNLSCTTLVYLKLNCFDIQIPESVISFPYLKTLDLYVMFPANVVVFNQLLSSCPVLEKIYLHGFIAIEFDFDNELKIDISAATLKRIFLYLRDMGDIDDAKKHYVIIDTPKLEYLSINDNSFTKYVVKNIPLISNVFVNYEAPICTLAPKYSNHILELFKGIFATELLTLHWNTIDILEPALRNTWPTFPYLKTLILQLSDLSGFSGWTRFAKFLHCAPFLNVLILDLERINDLRSPGSNVLYQWTQPNTVPKCLLEHLKKIAIQHFEGNKDELEAMEYLLNNAKVLERMMIGYESEYRSEEVRQKLLMSPRASKSCEVEIYQHLQYENDIHNALTKVTIWGM